MGKYRRVSMRLKGYDYASYGFYFITVCVKDREALFGKIVDGELILNEYGRIVKRQWRHLARKYHHVNIDAFVVMPNHFHGIIQINQMNSRGGVTPPLQRPALGNFVAYFKYQTTKQINARRNFPGQKIWQRGYYDHIIRDDVDLSRVREYIQNNPRNWEKDEYFRREGSDENFC